MFSQSFDYYIHYNLIIHFIIVYSRFSLSWTVVILEPQQTLHKKLYIMGIQVLNFILQVNDLDAIK